MKREKLDSSVAPKVASSTLAGHPSRNLAAERGAAPDVAKTAVNLATTVALLLRDALIYEARQPFTADDLLAAQRLADYVADAGWVILPLPLVAKLRKP